MKTLKIITFILTVIGAVNWGLIGLFRFDLVASIFGEMSYITRIIYSLVGFSGLFSLISIYGLVHEEM